MSISALRIDDRKRVYNNIMRVYYFDFLLPDTAPSESPLLLLL